MSHLGDELSALLDGELDEEDSRRVGAHLAGCDVCRSELAGISEARTAVRGLPVLDVPGDLFPAPAGSRLRVPRWVAAAAAVFAVVVGAGVILAGPSSEPVPAAELSVLFAAYTAEGPDVAMDVPATTAVDQGRRDRAESQLPSTIAGALRRDLRTWDDGMVAYYTGGRRRFLVLVVEPSLDTESFVGSEVEEESGTYLRGNGSDSVIYVWDARGKGMALVGDLSPSEASEVLEELPPPDGPGIFERWWEELTG